MSLTADTKLGPYEIQSPLGAGGMGEVYRARDTRLDRTVAIKVLASHLSSSPELKQRMEREARAISSLNHPHICQLYDIGSQDGTDFLVMEFLEGETLAEKLRKGGVPLAEVLKIGIDVAEALAVAHRSGIVHRDLKPGNIMVTAGGAKLMDFGLAKPVGMQPAVSGSGTGPPSFTAVATLSGPSPLSPLTAAGSIVGTIQYMAPEQIEGKEADARSDIFAFGTVLYEMVAGKRPFSGKSQISLASSILESDPAPISALKPNTPAAFEHVVTICLEKNPEERYQSAHDIKLELQWIAAGRQAPPVATTAPAKKRQRIGWAVVVAVAMAVGAAAAILFYHPAQSVRSIRAVIDPPEKTSLNLTGDAAGPPVLSPDGESIAFAATAADGKTALWVRPMNTLEARLLPGTAGAMFPFWSPDSRSIGFFAETKLKTIDLSGGTAQVLCDATLGRGAAWGPGDVILFSACPISPLMRVNASGGTPSAFTTIDAALHTSHRWPFFLPDGKHVLYLAMHHDPTKAGNNMIVHDVAMIIFDTSMRPEEVFHMQVRQIDFMGRNITVEHGKTANARRCVPLSDRFMDMMKVRISGKNPEDWVFPSARSTSGRVVTVEKEFLAVRAKMGLDKRFVLYSARHTFGTHVSRAGNLKLAMAVLGHSDVRTSMRYMHPETELIREIINQKNAPVEQTGLLN